MADGRRKIPEEGLQQHKTEMRVASFKVEQDLMEWESNLWEY